MTINIGTNFRLGGCDEALQLSAWAVSHPALVLFW